MSDELTNTGSENFYTLVQEQGMILLGDDIINLRKVGAIRKQDGKTLVYFSGSAEPIVFPAKVFDDIRENVFSIEDLDDEEDFEEEEDE